jgi:integrase
MTILRLKFVQVFHTPSGKYFYFRKRGAPRIRLPGLPGSHEFMAAYAEALAAAPVAIGAAKRSKPGSVSAALAEYYTSQAFRSLTGGTPARRRAELERFRTDYGQRLIASLPKEFLVALLDSMPPYTARNMLKALRHFTRWCEIRKLVRSDPTAGIRIKVPKSDGHHTWTEAEIATFEAHYPVGSKARLALALGIFTAQRRGDVIRMGRQHVRDGVLTVRQQKTGATLAIPVHPELQRIIAATPIGNLTLLTMKSGKGYSANDFSDQFRAWCDAAGLGPQCTFHGLRKLALTRLANAGCSAHELAAISGHASLKEVERYTRKADQARLARAALAKGFREQNGTESVEPVPSPVTKPLMALRKNRRG